MFLTPFLTSFLTDPLADRRSTVTIPVTPMAAAESIQRDRAITAPIDQTARKAEDRVTDRSIDDWDAEFGAQSIDERRS